VETGFRGGQDSPRALAPKEAIRNRTATFGTSEMNKYMHRLMRVNNNVNVGGKPEEKNHCEYQDVGGWTILKWILERKNGMEWIRWLKLRLGTSRGIL
jgi:hypothetical protein